MILLIDNYDSFSYNLYQLTGKVNKDIKCTGKFCDNEHNKSIHLREARKIEPLSEIGQKYAAAESESEAKYETELLVIRNDELSLKEIEELNPENIIISPGPGHPKDAGICEDVIRYFAGKKPILGICLGHQAICEVFGATITYAEKIMHGKSSEIILDNNSKLFYNLPHKIKVGRYHSLSAKADFNELKITAKTQDNIIMAVEHEKFDIFGLQFHPESILTEYGEIIIRNFLERTRR